MISLHPIWQIQTMAYCVFQKSDSGLSIIINLVDLATRPSHWLNSYATTSIAYTGCVWVFNFVLSHRLYLLQILTAYLRHPQNSAHLWFDLGGFPHRFYAERHTMWLFIISRTDSWPLYLELKACGIGHIFSKFGFIRRLDLITIH